MAVVVRPGECILCEACLDACSRGAIVLRETAEVDMSLCSGCGACVNVCPNRVLEIREV